MTDPDLRWDTEYLGHSQDVHKKWYRLKDTTVELNKVARVPLTFYHSLSVLLCYNLCSISVKDSKSGTCSDSTSNDRNWALVAAKDAPSAPQAQIRTKTRLPTQLT
ncbi:hypothetical protein CHS0354_028917 [Potamilus streckersoni]|uniref:Uncharacterized protein n=1 Tax=Potamilus streckersoni TaxID=2493646 RepID=A0AAE0SJI4_9BIVA|nr:hypothetical protein CHS0354_028917 [Potamilus streckersoni]